MDFGYNLCQSIVSIQSSFLALGVEKTIFQSLKKYIFLKFVRSERRKVGGLSPSEGL